MNYLKRKYIKSEIKNRDAFSNKGDYGHALLIAGKKGYMGAAAITANACLRSGVGLLTVCVPSEERFIVQCSIPEAMLIMREDYPFLMDKFSALGIGPGLGIDDEAKELLQHILTQFKNPILLDADALTIISKYKKLLKNIPKNTIITPHAIEFDRLFGIHQNNEDRIETAIKKAKELHIIIVLKGHQTAIISADKIFYNTTGNAGLAKGGSGDALTGVITSFLAQGYEPLQAANFGVFFHGMAADITIESQSMESMLITDVIENFGNTFKRIVS